MIVYIVCEIGHEDSGTIQAIKLVTLDPGEADRAVKRLGEHGHFLEAWRTEVA